MKPRFRFNNGYWVCREYGKLFIFDERQMKIMLQNYRAGRCAITEKGLIRYMSGWVCIKDEEVFLKYPNETFARYAPSIYSYLEKRGLESLWKKIISKYERSVAQEKTLSSRS